MKCWQISHWEARQEGTCISRPEMAIRPRQERRLPRTKNARSEIIGAPLTRCDHSLTSELKSASIVAGICQKAENRVLHNCRVSKSALFEHPQVRTYLWLHENPGISVMVLLYFSGQKFFPGGLASHLFFFPTEAKHNSSPKASTRGHFLKF